MPDSCCNSWTKAQESGTDNEHYGALLSFNPFYEWKNEEMIHTGKGDWSMGNFSELGPVHFCPWCGAKKTTTE